LLVFFFIFGPAHTFPIEWAGWQEPTQPSYGDDYFDREISGIADIRLQGIESNIEFQNSRLEM
jgi:hypothetical protein